MDKIVIILNNNPETSGVGRYAYSLYREFSKINYSKIKLEFISWDKELFNEFFYMLKIVKLNWLYYLLRFKILEKSLKTNNALIHVTNAGYLASLITKFKQKSLPVVVTVHDTIPMNMRDSLAHKIAGTAFKNIAFADHVICVSEHVRRNIRTILGGKLDQVTTIHYGVDHSIFRPRKEIKVIRRKLQLPEDKFIILNVGSEEPRKNIPVLIRAFYKLVRDYRVNAVLVRVGQRSPGVNKIIKLLGLENKVIYRIASSKEVALYYNAADLLVHPAYYEDFGMSILEALASGCPVVASNKAAIPEVIHDSGILLDPFDIQGFAHEMHRILIDEDLRIKLSEKGLKRSLYFNWQKCAAKTLEVYQNVLSRY